MLPKVFGYHAHIYFQPGTPSEQAAKNLADEISERFKRHLNEVLVYVQLVGPHTQPNYALHLKAAGFSDIVGALQLDSRGLSILIHPETGNDEEDHALRAMWIGKSIDLDMDYFKGWRE